MPDCRFCDLGQIFPEGPMRGRCDNCGVMVTMDQRRAPGDLVGALNRRRARRAVRRRNPRRRPGAVFVGACWPPPRCPECHATGTIHNYTDARGAQGRCTNCHAMIPRDGPYVSVSRVSALLLLAQLMRKPRHA